MSFFTHTCVKKVVPLRREAKKLHRSHNKRITTQQQTQQQTTYNTNRRFAGIKTQQHEKNSLFSPIGSDVLNR